MNPNGDSTMPQDEARAPAIDLRDTYIEDTRREFSSNQEILEAWLEAEKDHMSPRSLKNYRCGVRRFMEAWGDRLVSTLSRAELYAYLKALRGYCSRKRRASHLTPKEKAPTGFYCLEKQDLSQCGTRCPAYKAMRVLTVIIASSAITRMYQYLVHCGFMKHNPMTAAAEQWIADNKYDIEESRRRTPTDEEVTVIVNQLHHPTRRFAYIMAIKTLARRLELFKLRLDPKYYRPDLGYIEIPPFWGKRKGNRKLILDAQLHAELLEYLLWRRMVMDRYNQRHDFLFVNEQGAPMDRCNSSRWDTQVRGDMERLGLQAKDAEEHERITLHCFRHYGSEHLKLRGCNSFWYRILRGDVVESTEHTYAARNIIKNPAKVEEIRARHLEYAVQLDLKPQRRRGIYDTIPVAQADGGVVHVVTDDIQTGTDGVPVA